MKAKCNHIENHNLKTEEATFKWIEPTGTDRDVDIMEYNLY
jgi:hypothetical protein